MRMVEDSGRMVALLAFALCCCKSERPRSELEP